MTKRENPLLLGLKTIWCIFCCLGAVVSFTLFLVSSFFFSIYKNARKVL